MFKKVSLLAAGATAEYTGTSTDIDLCTASTTTQANYAVGVDCYTATIKLEGGDPPADNEATDGYKATMNVGFTAMMVGTTKNMFYGICVLAKAMTTEDATAYQKAPRGMCLGTTTATMSNEAPTGTPATTVPNAGPLGNFGKTGNIFCHNTYAAIVTTNSAANTTWTISTTILQDTPGLTTTAYAAQTAASMSPTGCTTMKANTTYGATTMTPATDTAFFDDNVSEATVAASGLTLAPMVAGTTKVGAIFYMPTEADTYADVPRLSPADTDGWVAYAPDVSASATWGKNTLQLSPTNASIVTAFATTVATGVAAVGAAALAF